MGRFRTGKNQMVPLRNSPHILVSFGQALLRKSFGYIPRQPWIPFEAAAAIHSAALPSWRVWEVGSGFSTLWLSDRVDHVVSIEASKEWYQLLKTRIDQECIENVDLRYEWRGDLMSSFPELEDETLDLLFVDGGPRGDCLINGLRKVRPGGYIYLDNWDNDAFWRITDREFLRERAGLFQSTREFIDYVPSQVGVYAGLLLRKA